MTKSKDPETLPRNADPAQETAAAQPPAEPGPEVISRYLKTLPNAPGVYRMLNAEGDVIYVGKARSLKNRVSNYTRLGGHTNRIARMISLTASMEFVTVRTEAEALLLEANLIKRFRPRFNVVMRDDKSFPYILITRADAGGHPKRRLQSADAGGHPKRTPESADAGGHPKRGSRENHSSYAPQILKHRGARNRKGEYFGPFASAGAVNRTIAMLQRAFLLRTCSDSVYDSRTRPCLLYQIKRCAGPCTGEISLQDYDALVDEAVRFLKGESQNVRQMYQRLMEEAAENLEYERAAKYRNRLWALAHVTSDQAISAEGIEEADVFAIHQEGGQNCIQVFFFRTGQNWGNRAYFPKADKAVDAPEVMASFIAQFYDDKPIPRLILISEDLPERELLAEALAVKAGRKVELLAPKRGGKTGLVGHALTNAKEALGRKLAESASQAQLLAGVAQRFGLETPPRRIEVFDNSHTAGTNAVGAMIVAGPEGLVKNQYRKFNIKSEAITAGDDYAMMREVLTRRFKRVAAALADTPSPPGERAGETADQDFDGDPADPADTADTPAIPDLVLVDGGAGQLAVAWEILADLGLADRIPVIGVAKGPDRDAGREHFHIPGADRPVMLEPRDPVLYFVQRLRDEAHRFAIGTHRAKRAKAISANPLDEIPGIGPTRRRALMKHFGSAKSVSRANVKDLTAVEGISAEMAQRIYDFFHERKS